MWNQISTPNFAYQNDQRNKIYTSGDFKNKTPTYMAATHAISKSKRNFQNRIPRELDKKFYIPRFVVIHWITSNIQIFKNRHNFFLWAIFLVSKIEIESVNHPDPGDIQLFVQFPGNSFLEISLWFWNCVGCVHMRGRYILEITQCVCLITLVILICDIGGTYLISHQPTQF